MSSSFSPAVRPAGPEESPDARFFARRVFRDPSLQRVFEEQGVVVVSLLDAAKAKETSEALLGVRGERLVVSEIGGKTLPNHHSQLSEDPTYRQRVAALAGEAVAPRVQEVLLDFREVSAGVVVKAPQGGGTPLHSDWPLTRDPDDVTLTVWCPLVDVDGSNGGLMVVPGSHRLVRQINGPKVKEFHLPFQQKLHDHAVSIPLKAGEALVFDHTLLHGSPPNRSDTPRPALMLNYVPADAEAVFYRPGAGDGSACLEVVAWPAGGYLGAEGQGGSPEKLRVIPNPNSAISYEEYIRLFEDAKKRRHRAARGESRNGGLAGLWRKWVSR
jgi:ectoine hydroxylase-related dioxygenase (phytanoyl-CoA dioxygenase family)